MAQTYQVKSGETLSQIGAKYGVDWRQITGFKSGNPNLIYPGETLTIPDKVGAGVQPTAQPQVAVQQQVQPQSTGVTPEGIAISSLPPDLVWNGQLDVSNPIKQAKYQQIVGQQPQQQTQQPSGVQQMFSAQPQTPDLSGQWDKFLETINTTFQPQIAAGNEEMKVAQDKITARTEALNVALGKINDNPYYSEATRVGRARKLQEQYNNDVALLNSQVGIAQNKVANVQNQIATAKADAQVKLNIDTQMYNIKNQQYQNNLQMFNSLLTSGALNTATGTDIAQIATMTGMSTSMVQSIIDAAKKSKEVKPEIRSVEDQTGQYIVGINPTTLEVIAKNKVGEAKPKEASVTATNQALEEQAAVGIYSGIIQQAMAGGATPEQAVQAAVAVANNVGTKIDLKTQGALLKEAQKYKSMVSAPVTETTTQGISGGLVGGLVSTVTSFFSNLFKR